MAKAYQKYRMKVLDSYISYIDTRAGEHLIVFLHGNPMSSYVWRDIIRQIQGYGRCFVPDLIGMGDSGKVTGLPYRFEDQYRYFKAWMDAIPVFNQEKSKIIFICQEWGSALAFHWSNEHQNRIEALIHMESIVAPFGSYQDFGSTDIQENIRKLREDTNAEDWVLKDNLVLEDSLKLLPRRLTNRDLEPYRTPFHTVGESRRPTLSWVQELPIEGNGPSDVVEIVSSYSSWLKNSSNIPKLYIHAKPGQLSPWVRKVTEDWPNQQVVEVFGGHFLQEDAPNEVGHAILEFIKELGAMRYRRI